jgi:hypothetical protein
MRYLITGFLLLLHIATGGAQAPADIHGTWTAEIHTGKVSLQVRTAPPADWTRSGNANSDWNMGQSLPIDDLQGLANSDAFTMASVKFDLRREAGSMAFEGSFRDGRGAGLFTFAPRDAYPGEMRALGYAEDLPLWRRFQLALYDVGPRYIRDLKSEGYDTLTLDVIQRARTHGVTIDYIKDIKGQGFNVATIEELVRTRDHGVTQPFVEAMKKAGFTGATLEDLVRARDHGLKPDYVADIRRLGLGVTTLEQFVRLRDHGVTVDYVKALESQGFKNVPVEDIVRTRDHGVSAEFVADMKDIGLKDLTLPQLVRLRDHGITPGFVSHARARGYKTTDPEELVRLKNGGLWK